MVTLVVSEFRSGNTNRWYRQFTPIGGKVPGGATIVETREVHEDLVPLLSCISLQSTAQENLEDLMVDLLRRIWIRPESAK